MTRCALMIIAILAMAAIAHGDIVHMKDGRKIEGEVTKSTASEVVVKTRFGNLTLKRIEVARIEKKETIEQSYRKRYKALDKEKPGDVFELAMWCKENKLKKEYKKLLKEVLKLRPQHDGAHEELGHVKYRDKWFSKKDLLEYRQEEERINREKGLVLHEGKWMTPDEKMEAMGYVKVGEEWVTAVEADRLESQREIEEAFGFPMTITNSKHYSVRSTEGEEEQKSILAMCELMYEDFMSKFQPDEIEQKIIDFAPTSVYVLDDLKNYDTWISSGYYHRYKPPKNTIDRYKDGTNFSYYFPRPVVVVCKGRHLTGGGDKRVSLHGFISHHAGNVLIRRFKRGGKIPGWIEAGVAAYYEGLGNHFRTLSLSEYDGFEHVQKWVRGFEVFPEWFKAIATPDVASSLPTLSALMDRPVEEINSREICKAFSMIEFLLQEHREPFVQFVRRSLTEERGEIVEPEAAFKEEFGKSLEAIDAEWLQWTRSQRADRSPLDMGR